MRSFATYCICTSPRSGSTLLCDLLRSTGAAGNPRSYFHRPTLADWCRDLGVGAENGSERQLVAALLQAAAEKGRAGTDLFGLRLQRHSFPFFIRTLRHHLPDCSGDRESMETVFGPILFIHLSRASKIDQAISYFRAKESGLWHLNRDGSERERLSPHKTPVYDGARLRELVSGFIKDDLDWERWFERERIVPVRVSYDDLAADPVSVLRRLLQALHLDVALAEGVTPGVAKMADAESRAWAERYQADG